MKRFFWELSGVAIFAGMAVAALLATSGAKMAWGIPSHSSARTMHYVIYSTFAACAWLAVAAVVLGRATALVRHLSTARYLKSALAVGIGGGLAVGGVLLWQLEGSIRLAGSVNVLSCLGSLLIVVGALLGAQGVRPAVVLGLQALGLAANSRPVGVEFHG